MIIQEMKIENVAIYIHDDHIAPNQERIMQQLKDIAYQYEIHMKGGNKGAKD